MVSIIVPVYNTGKRLEKCLTSILNQTYEGWECIVVNDCSTDKTTINILGKWKSNKLWTNKYIFIDKKTNEGVDQARFDGLSVSKGDYITFVDSDDWLDSDALESLVKKAAETDADIVVGNMRKVYWEVCPDLKAIVQNGWKGR